jgi:hypothetical protein
METSQNIELCLPQKSSKLEENLEICLNLSDFLKYVYTNINLLCKVFFK